MDKLNTDKIQVALDYTVLGVAVIAGLSGAAGLAIAGVAIYLTSVKLFQRV